MRVAANLTFLFTEYPLLERYGKAAEAGFKLVEVGLPYSEEAEALRKAADEHGVRHVLINAPAGDWSKGDRGLGATEENRQVFMESVKKAVEYAKVLDIHIMSGIRKHTPEAWKVYSTNIIEAAKFLNENGNITCIIEPINHTTIPDYFLHTYEQAYNLIQESGLPNLKILMDLFHTQQICGQLVSTATKYKDYIGHIQVAQVPNRHEPSYEGEIDYKYVLKKLGELNGDWTVGCEYNASIKDSLKWVKDYGHSF